MNAEISMSQHPVLARIAQNSRSEHLLNVDDPEGAGYHLQEAGEKYLEGFLLSSGWKLKRIHDLEVLLNDALKFAKSLENYRSLCQKITGYYIIDRYPLPAAPLLTKEEVQESVAKQSNSYNA